MPTCPKKAGGRVVPKAVLLLERVARNVPGRASRISELFGAPLRTRGTTIINLAAKVAAREIGMHKRVWTAVSVVAAALLASTAWAGPLHEAARLGDGPLVQKLVGAGADVDR